MKTFRHALWGFGFFAILAGPRVAADRARSPTLLDPQMTPGDVLTTDAQIICVPGYTKTVRHVPHSLKNQVYRQYGVVARTARVRGGSPHQPAMGRLQLDPQFVAGGPTLPSHRTLASRIG